MCILSSKVPYSYWSPRENDGLKVYIWEFLGVLKAKRLDQITNEVVVDKKDNKRIEL